MNDKIRFVVLTTLLIVILPITLLLAFVSWLEGGLEYEVNNYICFYERTWK